MLFLFRTNQIAFNLLLLFYVIILRGSYFINPVPSQAANNGILSNYIKDLIGGNTMLEGVIVILLLFIQAFLLNNLTMKHRLFREMTLLPGLFYLLLMSLLQDFFPLSAILFGNLFLIIALDEMLSTYKQPKCAGSIFNSGFWIGVASLFYSSFGLFLLLVVFGISFLRVLKLKEFMMLLSGFLIPFLFISTWAFWNDQLGAYWHTYFAEQFSFLNFQYEQTRIFLIKLILLIAMFLFGFFNGYEFGKTNQIRSYVKVIYLTLFVSGLTFLFQPNVTILHFLIIMVPLSLLVTARFLSLNTNLAEFIHTILLIAVLFFQYRSFESLIGS